MGVLIVFCDLFAVSCAVAILRGQDSVRREGPAEGQCLAALDYKDLPTGLDIFGPESWPFSRVSPKLKVKERG